MKTWETIPLAVWSDVERWLCPYTTFWANQPSPVPCPKCNNLHNLSLHGYLAFCPNHPWHKAWSWPRLPLISQWYSRATHRDRYLKGKLCVPDSLYQHLRSKLGCRSARTTNTAFQTSAMLAVMKVVGPYTPQGGRSCPNDRVCHSLKKREVGRYGLVENEKHTPHNACYGEGQDRSPSLPWPNHTCSPSPNPNQSSDSKK